MLASDRQLPVSGGPEKRAYVRSIFTAIAPTYDRLNRIISFRFDQGWRRTAVAVPEAWGAGPQPVPVPNMMVDLTINGRSMGSTTTDGAGRFRFDGMPSGMYELRIHDASGRYTFTYSMNMGTGQTMAVYCVMWGSGSDVSETCTQQAGDHWNDMMQGVPAGHWDTEHHGWMAGPSGMM